MELQVGMRVGSNDPAYKGTIVHVNGNVAQIARDDQSPGDIWHIHQRSDGSWGSDTAMGELHILEADAHPPTNGVPKLRPLKPLFKRTRDIEKKFHYKNFWLFLFSQSLSSLTTDSGESPLGDLGNLCQEKKHRPLRISLGSISPHSTGLTNLWNDYWDSIMPPLRGRAQDCSITIPNDVLKGLRNNIPLGVSFGWGGSDSQSGLLPGRGFPKNRQIKFVYEDKALMLPAFYDAPFGSISVEEARTIAKKMGWGSSTMAIATSSRRSVPLSFIVEDDESITIHLFSLAGLYFVKEFILNYIGATADEMKEMSSRRAMMNLAKRVIQSSQKDIEEARKAVSIASEGLSRAHRNLFSLEKMSKEKDIVKIYQQELSRIKTQCEKDSQIEAVWFDAEGTPWVETAPLAITFYEDDGEPIMSSDYDKQFHTKTAVPFGRISANLKTQEIYSLDKKAEGFLYHPHVHDTGDICLGDGDSLYCQLVGRLDLVGAIRVLLTLLQKYNPDSPCNEQNAKSYTKRLKDRGITPQSIAQHKRMTIEQHKSLGSEIIFYREKLKEKK